MAWTKNASWVDLIGSSGTRTLLAAAGASSGSIVVENGASSYLVMGTQIYYGASTAASDLTIEWFGWDCNGTSLVDTIAMYEVKMTGSNGASVKGTYQMNISAVDGLKVQATNNDDTDGASIHMAAMFAYI